MHTTLAHAVRQFAGFCTEHSTSLKQELVFEDMGRLEHLKELLESSLLHLGKEALVVTVAQIGSSKGHAVPVLAGASCKASDEYQQRDILQMVCTDDWSLVVV